MPGTAHCSVGQEGKAGPWPKREKSPKSPGGPLSLVGHYRMGPGRPGPPEKWSNGPGNACIGEFDPPTSPKEASDGKNFFGRVGRKKCPKYRNGPLPSRPGRESHSPTPPKSASPKVQFPVPVTCDWHKSLHVSRIAIGAGIPRHYCRRSCGDLFHTHVTGTGFAVFSKGRKSTCGKPILLNLQGGSIPGTPPGEFPCSILLNLG